MAPPWASGSCSVNIRWGSPRCKRRTRPATFWGPPTRQNAEHRFMTMAGQRCAHDPDGLNSGAWPVPADQLITPTDNFFTRSHAPVPTVDPRSWRLEVTGLVQRPRSFSLEEL